MKVIGWIGILHVTIIIAWMIVNIVFSAFNPLMSNEGGSTAEIGIAYYSAFPGYLGFDHGSKALVMVASIVLPIGLFLFLGKVKDFTLLNMIALITGCLGFVLYGLSLMLQAVTVEYAFNLYNSNDTFAQSFSIFLYDWSMLKGGFSVSIYIIANLLLACWVILHSLGLFKQVHYKKLSTFGFIVGILHIIGYFISWFYLMQANQNMHHFNEAVGLTLMVWILIISIKMIQGKIKV